jgi:hypothetical protein
MSAKKTWDCRKPLPPTWKTTPDPFGRPERKRDTMCPVTVFAFEQPTRRAPRIAEGTRRVPGTIPRRVL